MKKTNLRNIREKLQFLLLLAALVSGCSLTIGTTSTTSVKSSGETLHTVMKGENLFRISKYYYDLESTIEIHKGIERIKKANGMEHEQLSVGQRISIPGTDKKQPRFALTPPVAPSGETPGQAAPPESRQEEPPVADPLPPVMDPVPIVKDKMFLWPAKGRIICNFGELGNQGIDIAVSSASEVVASNSGKVIFAGTTAKHQETVILEHQNDIYTVYGHDMEILVKQGDTIGKGDNIGKVKSGTHRIRYLHFEIRIGTVPVNPLIYLPEQEKNGR